MSIVPGLSIFVLVLERYTWVCTRKYKRICKDK